MDYEPTQTYEPQLRVFPARTKTHPDPNLCECPGCRRWRDLFARVEKLLAPELPCSTGNNRKGG